jgi:hypothetical protein
MFDTMVKMIAGKLGRQVKMIAGMLDRQVKMIAGMLGRQVKMIAGMLGRQVKMIAGMLDRQVKMIAGMLGRQVKMIVGRLIVSHCPGWGLASLCFHLHRAINDHFENKNNKENNFFADVESGSTPPPANG